MTSHTIYLVLGTATETIGRAGTYVSESTRVFGTERAALQYVRSQIRFFFDRRHRYRDVAYCIERIEVDQEVWDQFCRAQMIDSRIQL